MLAVLSDYILVSHFSHVIVLGYTLWALGFLPGSKNPRMHDAPGMLLPVIASFAALVFVDGGISQVLYYGSVPENWLFHFKALLAAAMLFYPHLSTESLRVRSPRHLALDCYPLIIFGVFLALSWISLPWMYDNFPGFPDFKGDPAWFEVWNILLTVPFQTIPLIYAFRFVYLDLKQRQRTGINTIPPPRYGALPDTVHNQRHRGDAADTEDDTMHYLVAYFALLPILWQLNGPWDEMNSFQRTISVLSTNSLIMTVMTYYYHLVKMVPKQEVAV
ncbi:hypothetical protein AGABI2DRAFT_191542 [Agaricus bisporus var. bisporus H97]|uniref:hypothetical protein n=1 Tax=Agaricus bisporus var. bisporus (strain H97 / ATCC MYA-4626 / FGSC 10389) TaxID=936046 RepID=UPI00029F55EC|nr:hypothetical protein AGABI2DRAFT_191542 [Agaricus bisporus var. bisporus H97]EKV49563.1 hypothetical protein AGABI2DRAFT_191542 [Agaricus bisporus var. bisporus H97]